MYLFENEIINISKIYTVNMYEMKTDSSIKNIIHYPSKLSAYELIFFISGELLTCFNGNMLKDTANSIRYLPKDISGGEYTVEKIASSLCIDIFFDTLDEMPDYAVSLKNMNELKPLFTKIYNIWNSKELGFYSECMSIFYDIIKKIKKHTNRYFTDIQAKKILPSYNYMIKHFTQRGFNYKKMCAESSLSYDYFKEIFIKEYGMPPVKYVTMLKLDKAKELLITGHYTISEIAEICGFENIYYFSTVFKKHFGVSPKNYRTMIN